MNDLGRVFSCLKGQPIEIITESGFKFCGIEVEYDNNEVVIIDDKGRPVHIQVDHIDAVLESQKKLERLCGDSDCDCGCDGNCKK